MGGYPRVPVREQRDPEGQRDVRQQAAPLPRRDGSHQREGGEQQIQSPLHMEHGTTEPHH